MGVVCEDPRRRQADSPRHQLKGSMTASCGRPRLPMRRQKEDAMREQAVGADSRVGQRHFFRPYSDDQTMGSLGYIQFSYGRWPGNDLPRWWNGVLGAQRQGCSGPRCGDQALGGAGWPGQTEAAGGCDLGLAQLRLTEVGSARGPAADGRRFGLRPSTRSPQN